MGSNISSRFNNNPSIFIIIKLIFSEFELAIILKFIIYSYGMVLAIRFHVEYLLSYGILHVHCALLISYLSGGQAKMELD